MLPLSSPQHPASSSATESSIFLLGSGHYYCNETEVVAFYIKKTLPKEFGTTEKGCFQEEDIISQLSSTCTAPSRTGTAPSRWGPQPGSLGTGLKGTTEVTVC